MRSGALSSAYKRDVKRARRQEKNLNLLGEVVQLLLDGSPLPLHYRDHPLKGGWNGRRELHIEPDWLLIYHIEKETVFLERTGSHAELFRK